MRDDMPQYIHICSLSHVEVRDWCLKYAGGMMQVPLISPLHTSARVLWCHHLIRYFLYSLTEPGDVPT
jgi:hypothetical protein